MMRTVSHIHVHVLLASCSCNYLSPWDTVYNVCALDILHSLCECLLTLWCCFLPLLQCMAVIQ